MFLSALISFLLARRFSKRAYIILIITASALLAFFSTFGLMTMHQRLNPPYEPDILYYELHPIPLSFPFHASVFMDMPAIPFGFGSARIHYEINFVTIEIFNAIIYYYSFAPWSALIFYCFFLLIDVAGSVIGYWMAKHR